MISSFFPFYLLGCKTQRFRPCLLIFMQRRTFPLSRGFRQCRKVFGETKTFSCACSGRISILLALKNRVTSVTRKYFTLISLKSQRFYSRIPAKLHYIILPCGAVSLQSWYPSPFCLSRRIPQVRLLRCHCTDFVRSASL